MKKLSNLAALFFLSCMIVVGQSNIRQVDFRNFTYQPYCAGEDSKKVTVKNGEFSSDKQMDGYVDRFYFNIFGVTYGELTGDKKEEAVVLTSCNTGGTGNFTEGFIYSMKLDKPVMIARIPGGDRADGGLRKAVVENGLLIIEANDGERNSGACCPEGTITQSFRLSSNKLIAVGNLTKRDLFPKQRVSFARGSNGATLKVKIPASEGRRFIVGARAGQILSVALNRDKVQTRLLEDAIVTEGVNGFSAKLPKSGDYTVEVSSYEDTEIEVAVTIKIN